jgi:hypothetical protein
MMRIDMNGEGRANIVLTKSEWESYGRSRGWDKVDMNKQASSPSIELSTKDGESHLKMNYEGWKSIGKKAGFEYDEDESFDEEEYYSNDFDLGDKEDEENYLEDLQDVDTEVSGEAEEEYVAETISEVTATLVSSLLGIEDGQAPRELVPELIISALEPLSEFKDIDMMGDTKESLARYLESPTKSEEERELKSMIANALVESGNEV